MFRSENLRNWKKYALVGVIATVTPGGFIILGMYGIKKLLDKRKANVSTQGPEERTVSDS